MLDVAGPDTTIADFLDAAARKQPTPGGGSVTALVGALATSMGEMTLNYSTGRKANADEAERVLRENVAHMTRARGLLLELMAEDQRAYAELTAAKKCDDADPRKVEIIEQATVGAIRVPEAIMATGMEVIACAVRAAPHANRWLLSDLAVCGELAMATIRCGAINVAANLADVRDVDRRRLREESASIARRGVEALRALLETIEQRTRA